MNKSRHRSIVYTGDLIAYQRVRSLDVKLSEVLLGLCGADLGAPTAPSSDQATASLNPLAPSPSYISPPSHPP